MLGLVERRAGSTSLIKLGGLARLAPLLGVLFFVPAMNLAGIPPMSGFLGKVGAHRRRPRSVGTPLAYAVVAAGMVTSLLTLYAVAKTWNLAFWRTPEQAHEMALELSGLDPDQPERPASGPAPRPRPRRGGTFAPRPGGGPTHRRRGRRGDQRPLPAASSKARCRRGCPARWSLPPAAWSAFSLGLTVVAGPLFGYTERAAQDLLDATHYISSVLPGGSDEPADDSHATAGSGRRATACSCPSSSG